MKAYGVEKQTACERGAKRKRALRKRARQEQEHAAVLEKRTR